MNKKGDYCTLSPEWIINSTAQAEADMTLLMVKDIGRLDEGTKFIDETAEIWYIRALKKVTLVISDSFNQELVKNILNFQLFLFIFHRLTNYFHPIFDK